MSGNRNWSYVSFTPQGKDRIEFGDVSINFPSINAQETGEDFVSDPELVVGPVWIRIDSLRVASFPTFPKEQVGRLIGTLVETGILYVADNAKV